MATPTDKPETAFAAGFRHLAENSRGDLVSREIGPLRWMTDRGLCVATGARVLELYRRLAEARLPGVAELVPADGMLLIVLAPGASVPAGLLDILNGGPAEKGLAAAKTHLIPVRFDGEDLHEVAEQTGLAVEELPAVLCALNLRVKFLGFQPGFAYLDGLPPELHLPRRANPRKHVPAGSVALGGGYCGIYPSAGPGGWHLLGTADIQLFDPVADPPARLQPGDTVKLVAA
jgi:KipI family sensor histidine kinase inhibitor